MERSLTKEEADLVLPVVSEEEMNSLFTHDELKRVAVDMGYEIVEKGETMKKIDYAYAVFNLDYDKDYTVLLVSDDSHALLDEISRVAKESDFDVDIDHIIKYGSYYCKGGTAMFGLETTTLLIKGGE